MLELPAAGSWAGWERWLVRSMGWNRRVCWVNRYPWEGPMGPERRAFRLSAHRWRGCRWNSRHRACSVFRRSRDRPWRGFRRRKDRSERDCCRLHWASRPSMDYHRRGVRSLCCPRTGRRPTWRERSVTPVPPAFRNRSANPNCPESRTHSMNQNHWESRTHSATPYHQETRTHSMNQKHQDSQTHSANPNRQETRTHSGSQPRSGCHCRTASRSHPGLTTGRRPIPRAGRGITRSRRRSQ